MQTLRTALAVISLLVIGKVSASETWQAFVDHGDKPSIGYVLEVEGQKITGWFYVLTPGQRDLEKGVKYEMKLGERKGNDIPANVDAVDGQGTSHKSSFTIHLKSDLAGDEVAAEILEGDDRKVFAEITFRRRTKK